jgi:two-component system chemotaxis response regulator CheB
MSTETEKPVTLAPSAAFDVIAIAASAGGLRAISAVLRSISASLPAALIVLQHLTPDRRSLLPGILARVARLPVREAAEGVTIEPGNIYVAGPSEHIIVGPGGVIELTHTELVHHVRPSADLLFNSVANIYGRRAIAVVLTGSGADGAEGALNVKGAGGLVIAQDKATSEFFSMPDAAIRSGSVDLVLPLDEIGPMLEHLVRG